MPDKPEKKNVSNKKSTANKEPASKAKPKKSPAPKNSPKPQPAVKPVPEKVQQTKQEPVKKEPQPDTTTTTNPTGGISDFFKNLDFKTIIDTLSGLVTNYKKTIDIVKDSLTNANEFFEKVKNENFNLSIGFFVLVLAVTSLFGFINALIYGAPINAVGGVFMMIIVVPVFLLLFIAVANFILRLFGSKGTFIDTCKIACYASWIGTISSFPLFTVMGGAVDLFVSIITLALSTYIWIKGAIIVLQMDKDRAIMLIGGLFIIFCLFRIIF